MYPNAYTSTSLTNRSYGFKELAVLYFPNIAPASASIRLKQWIKDDKELSQALNEANFHTGSRILTPPAKDPDSNRLRLTILTTVTHIITHKTMIKQRNITLIVVHCTASRCTSNLTPSALEAEHKRQGFTECGYHYYITKDGRIHHMRDITHIGAHAVGHNTPSIGVAYEGGLDASGRATDTRTPAQKQSLETLLRFLKLTYPGARICGHRDLSPDLNHNGTIEPNEYIKQCPCFNASTEYGHSIDN